MSWSVVAAACFFLLSIAHSVLGEREILQPLFAQSWETPVPRWALERILRFAWHLTSIAWVGLGAAALGLGLPLTLAAVGLVSAAVVFILLRGHLAWPLFLLAGIAGLGLQGWLVPELLAVGVVSGVGLLVAIALLHLYWVFGGQWGLAAAIPGRPDGAPLFMPPWWLTFAVALALFCFAGLVVWAWMGAPPAVSWVVGLGSAVLVLRAIGDGRQVGLSKTQRETPFAQWDDRLFTPLALWMAGGAAAALLG